MSSGQRTPSATTDERTCAGVQPTDKVKRFIAALDGFKKTVPVGGNISVIEVERNYVAFTSYWFDAKFARFVESLGGEYEVRGRHAPDRVPLLRIQVYFL